MDTFPEFGTLMSHGGIIASFTSSIEYAGEMFLVACQPSKLDDRVRLSVPVHEKPAINV